MYKLLIDKGFRKTIYSNQKGQPVFYRLATSDPNIVREILLQLEVISTDNEDTFEGVKGAVEVTEDLKIAQYSFTSNSNDFWVFNQLTMSEFEQLLLKLPDHVDMI
jgi:hypothetical protein